MTNKFTPGPWKVSLTDDTVVMDKDANAVAVAVGDYDTHYEVTEANARLIAAAPDLYEALQMLHDETADYIRLNHLGDPHHNQSMQLARAALKLAKGE